jgi:hypothetical protein
MSNTHYSSVLNTEKKRNPNQESLSGRFLDCLSSRVGTLLAVHPAHAQSATGWKRDHRKLLGDVEPVGFVVQKVSTVFGLGGIEAAVISDLGNGRFEVVEYGDGYRVYTREQTEPITTKPTVNSCQQKEVVSTDNNAPQGNELEEKKEETSSLHQSSITYSPISIPLDGGNVVNSDVKPNDNHTLRQNNYKHTLPSLIKNQPKRGRPAQTHKLYSPEGFNWEDYPELEPHRSSVIFIFHRLHERRFCNTDSTIYDAEDYIPLHHDYMRSIDPTFPRTKKRLLELGILERDYYTQGTKSYGYRFSDQILRDATRRRIPIEDKSLIKRLADSAKPTTRTHRWLERQLFKLALSDIEEGFLDQIANTAVMENGGRKKDKLKAYEHYLERIRDNNHFFQPDDQGRVYTIPTIMKRELRQLLRVDGQKLQYIDINNSQLTFLALQMRADGVDCPDYFATCEAGQLYEVVAEKADSTRPQVKQAITQQALFSPNNAKCQKSTIKRSFDLLFPPVAQYLHDQKPPTGTNVSDGSALAKKLQSAEANLIIKCVCGKLRREGVEFVTPIHDSLLFLPSDGEYIKSIMADEFVKLGITPHLEIETL